MGTGKRYFVEPTKGGFSVKAEGAKKASAVLSTQKAAIARAKELNPNAKPNVARVLHTSAGHPDQFEKK